MFNHKNMDVDTENLVYNLRIGVWQSRFSFSLNTDDKLDTGLG